MAWHTRVAVPSAKASSFKGALQEGEPVVFDGTMFIPDNKGNVFAYDAATGERLWFYKPTYPKGFARLCRSVVAS